MVGVPARLTNPPESAIPAPKRGNPRRRNRNARPKRTLNMGNFLLEVPMANPRSTASIAGHPIHPMLIPFPVAFFVATLVCDVVFWRSGSATVAISAMWLLGVGIIMALLAAVVGLTDVLGDRRIFDLTDAWWHAGGNVLIVLIEV